MNNGDIIVPVVAAVAAAVAVAVVWPEVPTCHRCDVAEADVIPKKKKKLSLLELLLDEHL